MSSLLIDHDNKCKKLKVYYEAAQAEDAQSEKKVDEPDEPAAAADVEKGGVCC